ncbi:COX15/CtaA family protein [Hufsiella ginkgonis]|uniref:Heme A synthase n=1 Tax=Hufsiella ginkgonis TaxID=2695274 RepID=A0A7K1Y4H9_9SPHI|nr:COX15/CtaA family protein [Hufsiella ginkgonis]MXV17626.1 heme A synthase [Hufsiella ginkgonis]
MMFSPGERKFLAVNRITILSLFALILAGGIVRTSGSGMGCPDWPKCFESYVPPVSASQLPEGYKEKYVEKRVAKNERFAKTLDVLGYGEMAAKIRSDKSIREPEDFNAAKTWTEYINRLVGAVTGVFLLGCVIRSRVYLRTRKRIFFASLFNIVLVIFQAWLGSIVVSTNLLAWVVTVHMLLALGIVAISIYTLFEAQVLRNQALLSGGQMSRLQLIALLLCLLTLVQVTLGTGVREQVDFVADAMARLNRASWVQQVGATFNLHRDSALILTAGQFTLFYIVRKKFAATAFQYRYVTYSGMLIVLQVVTGVVLAYLALPPVAQAAHLVLATLLFSAQFYLMLLLRSRSAVISAVQTK